MPPRNVSMWGKRKTGRGVASPPLPLLGLCLGDCLACCGTECSDASLCSGDLRCVLDRHELGGGAGDGQCRGTGEAHDLATVTDTRSPEANDGTHELTQQLIRAHSHVSDDSEGDDSEQGVQNLGEHHSQVPFSVGSSLPDKTRIHDTPDRNWANARLRTPNTEPPQTEIPL